MTENYYTILQCDENASYEELKLAYIKLVKQHHPDKHDTLVTSEMFRKIDEAWKCLREASTRKEYDAKLMNDKVNNQLLVYANLLLNDLDWDASNHIYTYNCRCGGLYAVTAESIEEECVVACDECSFVIIIKNNVTVT